MEKRPTYQELLIAYDRLLRENEVLHKEVDRTSRCAGTNGTGNYVTRKEDSFLYPLFLCQVEII